MASVLVPLYWAGQPLYWGSEPLMWNIEIPAEYIPSGTNLYDVFTPILLTEPPRFREPIAYRLYIGVTFNDEEVWPLFATYYLQQQVFKVIEILSKSGYRTRLDTVFANGIIETRVVEAGPNRLLQTFAPVPPPVGAPSPTPPPAPTPAPTPTPGPPGAPPPVIGANSLDYSQANNSMYLPIL